MHSSGTGLPLLFATLSIGVSADNAMNLIPAPPWTRDQMKEHLSTNVALALRHGLNNIRNADTKLVVIDLLGSPFSGSLYHCFV